MSISGEVARAAVSLALTPDHRAERRLLAQLGEEGIRAAAVDCGGEATALMKQGIERAVVAAKREGVIRDTHAEVGAVAGAAHAALIQVVRSALGLNVGGKLGIARKGDHVAVAVFVQVGLVHLDDVAIGLGHRAVASYPDAQPQPAGPVRPGPAGRDS